MVMTDTQLWLAYAYFEIRRLDVNAARKVLGAGIGMCPKPKLFTGYIELEMRLREFDRVRTLYEKFLTVRADDETLAHSSTTRVSARPGSNGPRLKVPWKTLSESEPFSNWPCNKSSTCRRLFGR